MARLDAFLKLVVEQHASDLHFHAGKTPLARHDGEIIPLPFRSLSSAETRRFLYEVMTLDQRATFEANKDLDFVYALPFGRFRASVFMQSAGMGAVFRVIPQDVPTLESLGLPPVLKKVARLQNGLVLVTGPTGSGKTSTLNAMIHEVNATSARHILTIEDPIEVLHAPIKSVVTQRQVGEDTESFAQALRSAMRESPDVLVVGELRDHETVQMALSAAETGALVMGTLHTKSACSAVDRILDLMPEEQRDQAQSVLSVLLRCVIAQHLVKRADGEGRVAVTEVLLQNHAVSNMIREGKTHQLEGYLQSAASEETEMHSLDACIVRLVREGSISTDEGLSLATNVDVVRSQIADMLEDA